MRGQVTLYVILGLVLLITVILAFVYRDSITTSLVEQGGAIDRMMAPAPEREEAERILTAQADRCVEEQAEAALALLEARGGLLEPDEYVMTGNGPVALHLEGMPLATLEQVAAQYRSFIADAIAPCTLSPIDPAWDATVGEPEVSVSITETGISVTVEPRISVRTEDGTAVAPSTGATVQTGFGRLWPVRDAIIREAERRGLPDAAWLSSLDAEVSVAFLNQDTTLYTIRREGEELTFAVRTPANSPPRLAPIPDQVLAVGVPFRYALEATDNERDPLTYTVTGPLTAEADGNLTYTPGGTGVHDVTACAKDATGQACRSFRVEVQHA